MTEFDLAAPDISTNVRIKDFQRLLNRFSHKAFGTYINAVSHFNRSKAADSAIRRFSKVNEVDFRPRGEFNKSNEQIIQVNQRKISIYRFGDLAGPKVLLCHGWTGQASDFYRLISPLTKRGFQVIAFDGPAHGNSSGTHTNIFEFVEVISEIAKIEQNIEFAIGHSMGAASIVLANHNSADFNPTKIITVGAPDMLKTVFDQYSEAIGLNASSKEAMLKKVESLGGHPLDELSVAKLLDQASLNTMLVHDRMDSVIPFSRASEISSRAKGVKTVLETCGLGHIKILRDKKVINQMLNFLAS